ncbi:MAG: hypothetical protein KGZ75_01075 [Syntrophomonadaceae bacterium]|nr:hypothetical protein [Syntrophomonadaceae bacterium]
MEKDLRRNQLTYLRGAWYIIGVSLASYIEAGEEGRKRQLTQKRQAW